MGSRPLTIDAPQIDHAGEIRMTAAAAFAESAETRPPRTNLFLAAIMTSPDEGQQPVKVRNLSPGGAMLQAAVFPAAGTVVRLCRGQLKVQGTIAWTDGPRCGIAFSGSVSVRDWMANPSADSGSVRRAAEPQAIPVHLLLVARLLEQLGDVLVADADVLLRHGTDLQKLDIATQMLAAAAGTLQHRPDQRQRLADLCASAEEALGPLPG
jgi:hypothetical protein